MTRTKLASEVAQYIHRHLLKLIVASYLLAAVAPGPGLWIKDVVIADFGATGERATITIPKALLAVLLFSAGLRAKLARIGGIVRRPGMVFAGLAANVAVPLLFLTMMIPALGVWHNPDEAAVVLVGLALVSAMPIAGSSTGWAQAADGDMALSLGLVLGSTLLSPLTTPAALHALGAVAPARYGAELHHLAESGTGSFLAAWVLAPSLIGLAVRSILGESRAEKTARRLRIVAPLAILMLCYSNAAACLPQVLSRPDWDFLAIVMTFVVGLCVSTFAAGFGVARLVGADRGQRASLMFGLGMNNNGTGLVLASFALGAQPLAMLPIIVYNLAQHLVAGCVDAALRRTSPT